MFFMFFAWFPVQNLEMHYEIHYGPKTLKNMKIIKNTQTPDSAPIPPQLFFNPCHQKSGKNTVFGTIPTRTFFLVWCRSIFSNIFQKVSGKFQKVPDSLAFIFLKIILIFTLPQLLMVNSIKQVPSLFLCLRKEKMVIG